MHSEIVARITDQNDEQISLQVCQELCVGCNGRCGALLLANAGSRSISVSKPYFNPARGDFDVGNQVKVGVAVKTLIGLSSLVYLTPLVLMLLSAVVCFHVVSQADGAVAICAGLGLFSGLAVVRFLLARLERNQAAETLFIRRDSNGA